MGKGFWGFAAAALFALAILAQQARAQRATPKREQLPTPAEMKGKTAGEVYKNIHVLKNVPADQLIDGMRYITIALGVRCSFCHNTKDFPSDQKRTKRTARRMMSMLFAINKENFKGRQVVGCYTCHRGHERPVFAPLPATAIARPATGPVPPLTLVKAQKIKLAPGTRLPTVEQVLAKYSQALGGEAALAHVRTREIVTERTGLKVHSPPMQEEIFEKIPDRFAIVTHFRNMTFRSGYDGTRGWVSTRRGSRPLGRMDALVPARDASIDPPKALAGYSQTRLMGMARIGAQKTYLVTGRAPDGVVERLYFGVNSGLLLRRTFVYHTILGPLLFQADYRDYRKEGGVAIPFRTEWWAAGSGFTETVKSVKTNPTIRNAEFRPPPKKTGAAEAGPR